MPPEPDSHEIYLHLRVLIGVVLGLSLTRILSGLSRLVQHPGRVPLYAPHLLWVLVILVSAIHFWWWEFGLATIRVWRFELFVFILFYAFLWFLLASLLFPDDLAEYAGYEDYFLSRRRWFFGLFALTFVVDYFDTILKGPARLAQLGPEYEVRLVVGVLLCLAAMATRNRAFHLAFAGLFLLYDLSWIERAYDLLG
ncbi:MULTISPECIES: hypothetical protein [Sphingomonas]|uniref:Uncharacterized protein n=1 Tax=Edaphosphingomonas fennica TaxID=114404 RepID=A0A2T4I0C2_9SPHN|nr:MULTISPECIES: hypothetical protein [Sphingomonas]MDX3883095.1 hypothetical protein [Sphingomonas sp.]PTD22079.1 hypothetical protein CV103_09900 [Sphingomonas fennica]